MRNAFRQQLGAVVGALPPLSLGDSGPSTDPALPRRLDAPPRRQLLTDRAQRQGASRCLPLSPTPSLTSLASQGYGLYLDFRPDVDGWGKKAELRMSTILGLRRFLTHAPVDDAPEASSSKNEEEEEEEEGAREVKQELDGAGGPVRVKAEPEDDADGVEPAVKRVKREEHGGEEDVKPSVVAGEDEFDALLAEDDDLFAAVDL